MSRMSGLLIDVQMSDQTPIYTCPMSIPVGKKKAQEVEATFRLELDSPTIDSLRLSAGAARRAHCIVARSLRDG